MVRVAFVIASHSDLLARGLVELAAQMAPDVHFEAAGGLDDGGIGTSYDKIDAAVESALTAVEGQDDCGVVIVTDLGSATLTVESVLDFAEDPHHLVFVDAPLVEGTVAGAVRAQLGDSLGEVAAAVRAAFTPSTLGDETSHVLESMPTESSEVLRASAIIADPLGLHARPAALLARVAGSFEAEVTINGADAGSVLELMALGVKKGDTVELKASGRQARQALSAVVEAIESAG